MLHEIVSSVSPESASQLIQGIAVKLSESPIPAHVFQSLHSAVLAAAPVAEQSVYTEPPAWVILGAAFGVISLAQAGNIIWMGLKNRRR